MKLRAILLIIAACSTTVLSARSLKEKSMDMLYRYMPAADSVNYSKDFFSHNVDMSLRAREEMPWGKTVPEREFLHFVVPVRVNNEALDNHREVFYNELKDRVKGMSMKDAILEINHWCHEKVTYQPSDGRTHSPLQSVSSAIGRCGEESTFGVAALRAMGIPARQVYTPRWAHTDDNHAWVEAWADGHWYFLGACEPEPTLNLGWFNDPASRGMLMHARVFGPYTGSEEILSTADGITDINVTEHYAPVDTVSVTVTDSNGRPIENARVSFRIYNYAEFYPLATKLTDKQGNASLVTGLGDMLVWATDGATYNFKKARVGTDRHVAIELNPRKEPAKSIDLDLIPPVSSSSPVVVTASQRAINDERFAREDSIRRAYVATFVGATPGDTVSVLLARSRGNHATIERFLRSQQNSPKAIALLSALTEKDLTDVDLDVLSDHIEAVDNGSPLFARYVMSPRIYYERLTPFRSYFAEKIPADLRKKCLDDPRKWVEWVTANINASRQWYPASVTMDPARVWENRVTSPQSRDIFFVAGARSIGIPARIDPVTVKPQWADSEGVWHDAAFGTVQTESTDKRHKLTLDYTPNATVENPLYYTHFSLSKIKAGEPQQLNYPDFIPLGKSFADGEQLDSGEYMLVSGQRLANGGILAHIDFLDMTDGDRSEKLTLRSDNSQIQVIGSFDAESKFSHASDDALKSVLATTGRGYFVVGLLRSGHEPSNHVLRDIALLKNELEADGTPIVLLTDSKAELQKIDRELLDALPSTVTLGYDTEGSIGSSLAENTKSNEAPQFVIADTFNRVVYQTSGYTIGLGQSLLGILKRLK